MKKHLKFLLLSVLLCSCGNNLNIEITAPKLTNKGRCLPHI